jgi:hypothetical protein
VPILSEFLSHARSFRSGVYLPVPPSPVAIPVAKKAGSKALQHPARAGNKIVVTQVDTKREK